MIGINSNIPSLMAMHTLAANTALRDISLQRLATGQRINSGADDPAGLISSENLMAMLAQLEAETRSLERADNVAATADGALSVVSDLLVEAKGLAVASANTAGMSDAEIEANQMQLDSIMQTIDRLSSTTSFNGDKLLDGSASINVAGETLNLDSIATGDIGTIVDGAETYNLADTSSGGPISLTSGNIEQAFASIEAAANKVSTMRGQLGAFSRNFLLPTINSNMIAFENIAAANSAIRDTDYAAETSNLARLQALAQTSAMSLGIANQNPQNILPLLG